MIPRICTDIVTHIVASCRRCRRRCRKSFNSIACIGISFLLIRLAHGLMLGSLATLVGAVLEVNFWTPRINAKS